MPHLDHLGGLTPSSPPNGQDLAFPPQMVKIQVPDGFDLDSLPHFPPKWSRFGSNLFKMPASIFEADGYPLLRPQYLISESIVLKKASCLAQFHSCLPLFWLYLERNCIPGDALSPLTVGAILISVCDPKLREGNPRYFDQDYAWKVW